MLVVILVPATYLLILKPVFFGEYSIDYSLLNC